MTHVIYYNLVFVAEEKRLSAPQIMGSMRDVDSQPCNPEFVESSSSEEDSSDDEWEDEEMHRTRQPSMSSDFLFAYKKAFIKWCSHRHLDIKGYLCGKNKDLLPVFKNIYRGLEQQ